MLRRVDSDEAEVVSPDELSRRKEEAEWQRFSRAHGLDVRDEHARLALQLGETITVPTYTNDLWWFVRDVNGLDRTITAGTLIFDQPRERTFPFDLVEIKRLWHPHERNDAAMWWEKVQQRLPPIRRPARRRQAA